MQLVDIKSRSGRILISVSVIWFIISIFIGININSVFRFSIVKLIITMIVLNYPLIGFWLYRCISQGKPSNKALEVNGK
jgi:hypothetical protein